MQTIEQRSAIVTMIQKTVKLDLTLDLTRFLNRRIMALL